MRTAPRQATFPCAAALALLAGCAGAPPRPPVDAPVLRLAPAALGGELALEQRLTFAAGGRRDTVDALVEADARSLRIVLHRAGQVALRLVWDGTTLAEQRTPGVPETLQGERVVADLQLVYWPAAAVRAALPAGWTLDDGATRRTLRLDGRTVVDVRHAASGTIELTRPGRDFSLRIESAPVTR